VDFQQVDSLRRHLTKLHGGAPFQHQCLESNCGGVAFPTFEKLLKHQISRHDLVMDSEHVKLLDDEIAEMKKRFEGYRDIDCKFSPTAWRTIKQNPILDIYECANQNNFTKIKRDKFFRTGKAIGLYDGLLINIIGRGFAVIEIKTFFGLRAKKIAELLNYPHNDNLKIYI